MELLPQLKPDVFPKFICHLFNQLTLNPKEESFKIDENDPFFIRSEMYAVDLRLFHSEAKAQRNIEALKEVKDLKISPNLLIVIKNDEKITAKLSQEEQFQSGLLGPFFEWKEITLLASFSFIDLSPFYDNKVIETVFKDQKKNLLAAAREFFGISQLQITTIESDKDLFFLNLLIHWLLGEYAIWIEDPRHPSINEQLKYPNKKRAKYAYEYYKEYRKRLLSKVHKDKNLARPYSLKRLFIQDFFCIQDLDYNFTKDYSWVFFTGENGVGKTTLLQAIGVCLAKDLNMEQLFPIIQKMGSYPDARMFLFFYDNELLKAELFENTDALKELIDQRNFKPFPIFTYGVSRLKIQSEESQARATEKNNVFSLFNPTEGNLQNIEWWLKNQVIKGKYKTEDGQYLSKQTQLVEETLQKLMPSIEKIELNRDLDIPTFEYTEKGQKVTLSELSSGNKSILAMVGDLLIRLIRFFPKAESTKDFAGIVLIDELDMHLHPKWQRELPWMLTEIFPHIQFICTTHSLVPLMGAPENSLFFNVNRDEERGTYIEQIDFDLKNLSPNILLSSPLFGVDLLTKLAESKGESIEYRTEYDYKEYQQHLEETETFKKLQERYGDILGDGQNENK